MVCVALAAFVGVYVTEQLVGLLAPASAQVVLLKVPVLAVLEKVTVPGGAEAPAPAVSVTVAGHGVPCPAVTGEPQLTVVLVLRLLTAIDGLVLAVSGLRSVSVAVIVQEPAVRVTLKV